MTRLNPCRTAADYRGSQFIKRPRRGTLFELLVLRLVSDSFPGFRLFLVFPRVPIVRMLHGVRNCFFIFPIIDILESCPELEPIRSQLAQATERRIDFILVSRPSTVNHPRRLRQISRHHALHYLWQRREHHQCSAVRNLGIGPGSQARNVSGPARGNQGTLAAASVRSDAAARVARATVTPRRCVRPRSPWCSRRW